MTYTKSPPLGGRSQRYAKTSASWTTAALHSRNSPEASRTVLPMDLFGFHSVSENPVRINISTASWLTETPNQIPPVLTHAMPLCLIFLHQISFDSLDTLYL